MVSVIVVTRNSEATISDCLESILSLDSPSDEYEVIVVDGASTDTTREICKKYPVRLVCLDQAGIARQRNMGIGVAQGEHVAFTDSDCVVHKTWLTRLKHEIEQSDASIVAVGGPNLVFDSDPALSRVVGYAQETFLGSGGSPQSYLIMKPAFVNSIPNCNIIYKKDVVAKQRYNEAMNVGEDCDLNFRLTQEGYKFLYLPDIIVWHHRPSSIRDFVRKIFSYGEAMGRLTRQHRKAVRWYGFVAAFAVMALVLAYPILKLFPAIAYVYASAASLYAVALGISVIEVCKRYRSAKSLLAVVLLPMQHSLYGLSFMRGLLRG